MLQSGLAPTLSLVCADTGDQRIAGEHELGDFSRMRRLDAACATKVPGCQRVVTERESGESGPVECCSVARFEVKCASVLIKGAALFSGSGEPPGDLEAMINRVWQVRGEGKNLRQGAHRFRARKEEFNQFSAHASRAVR